MEINHILPFLDSLKNVLEELGVTDIKRSNLYKKESLTTQMEVTTFVGLVGDIRGNIAYSFSENTAMKLASLVIEGIEMLGMDEIARSAIGELSNMVTGNAATLLSHEGITFDITPPSVAVGHDIFFQISQVQTITIDVGTSVGNIEINIGLE